jgi:hypothetical protein
MKRHIVWFFLFEMSLVVLHSSSLHWWGGGGDKDLSFCGFRYSYCDFCYGFEQGKESRGRLKREGERDKKLAFFACCVEAC